MHKKASGNKELWISSLFIFSLVFICALRVFLSILGTFDHEIFDLNIYFWWISVPSFSTNRMSLLIRCF